MSGISGFALYAPAYRVAAADWWQWHGHRPAAGPDQGFRVPGPGDDVYRMAAASVLRLIDAYDLDPSRVGYLSLATESAPDTPADVGIVRELVDAGLAAAGRPRLAADCELPTHTQNGLGGLYAIKSALRYLLTDGAGRQAIVAAADVSSPAAGIPGQPVPGAGAVAILLEREPRLLAVDLAAVGVAAGGDEAWPELGEDGRRDGFGATALADDWHVVDAVSRAVIAMAGKRAQGLWDAATDWEAVVMHRPAPGSPLVVWGLVYLMALAEAGLPALIPVAEAGGVDPRALQRELRDEPGRTRQVADDCGDYVVYPRARKVLDNLAGDPAFEENIGDCLTLGESRMAALGNLRSASLPAWLAAALAETAAHDAPAAIGRWLAVGYGSRRVAEVWPLRLVPGWWSAARQIVFDRALADTETLDAAQYRALRGDYPPTGLAARDGRPRTGVSKASPDH